MASPFDSRSATKDDEFDFETFEGEEDIFETARDLDLLSTLVEPTSTSTKASKQRTAIIRTSDRIAFRRCRRKWNWSHSSRGNLTLKQTPGPFWLGTGLHFAFEDFHGHQKFKHPRQALEAYNRATVKAYGALGLPQDHEDLLHLGVDMLDYYEMWLESREPLKTLIIGNEPQVEVSLFIEIPKSDLRAFCSDRVLDLYDRILYHATLDRVIQDEYNRLWIVEYKSAKQYMWMHLETDPQVSAYSWIATYKYPNFEIAGTIYQQHKKQVLQPPKFLSSSKMFSISKQQKTSVSMYVSSLRNLFGTNENLWPDANRMYLDYLRSRETQGSDLLIRRDFVERSEQQIASEYQKILREVGEMLDPDLPIYPNPTRDCSWDCQAFQAACIGMDSGEDWTAQLIDHTIKRNAPELNWREQLRYPR